MRLVRPRLIALVAVALPASVIAQSLVLPPDTPALRSDPLVQRATLDPTLPSDLVVGEDRFDRMTLPVSVSGKGPFQFVVDTGSERTVISRQLASQLGLAGGRRAMVHSVGSSEMVDTVDIPHLDLRARSLRVADAPALEARHIGADGLLGIDSLQRSQVMFDFKSGRMSMLPSRTPVRATKEEDGVIVVRARSRKGRLIFTGARLDGKRVAVIVDTGSQYTVGNRALMEGLKRHKLELLPAKAQLISVTGAVTPVDIGKVGTLDIDGLKLTDFAVAFADVDIFRTLGLDKEPALLMGMNAMRAFDRMAIDFETRKVSFVLPKTSMRSDVRLAMLSK